MEQFNEFAVNHWPLVLAFVIVLILLLRNLFADSMAGYKQAGPSDAVGLINSENAAIVDIRADKDFKDGHILNALHIPLSEAKGDNAALQKLRDRPIIVVCRSGQQSQKVCGDLHKAGFESVYNLRGGMMAWKEASLPTSR